MFKADYKTGIVLGGDSCPELQSYDFDSPALSVVAGLNLADVPATVTETLTPKVSTGLEGHMGDSWNVYADKTVTWASQVVCAAECSGGGCPFSSRLEEVGIELKALSERE